MTRTLTAADILTLELRTPPWAVRAEYRTLVRAIRRTERTGILAYFDQEAILIRLGAAGTDILVDKDGGWWTIGSMEGSLGLYEVDRDSRLPAGQVPAVYRDLPVFPDEDPLLRGLTRCYARLAGAPSPIGREEPHPGWRDGRYTDNAGISWVLVDYDRNFGCFLSGEWVPDLTDQGATGWALLRHLNTPVTVDYTPDGACMVTHAVETVRYPVRGRTLAEAIARLATLRLGQARLS